jgi:hypothetical protein
MKRSKFSEEQIAYGRSREVAMTAPARVVRQLRRAAEFVTLRENARPAGRAADGHAARPFARKASRTR